ncbi:MAG: DNA methylase N-4 [Micavibrio sp.]|nr:DNA methylase N-4 [Micavibrio sp.]|tara:strand:- start:1155 stop:2447 length:1293 start_codon:yes stop_codon:yes gene_type:complete
MTTKIENIKLDKLSPYDNNPRTHSTKQIEQIVNSIKQFGFTIPILIDEKDMILAGHGRLLAARQMDLESVPCLRATSMSEAQKRAYIIADNKLTENGGWDNELLIEEFQYLESLDLDFDLSITGFETAEIDILLSDEKENKDDDNIPDVDETGHAITSTGDVWLLGKHKVICGDSLKSETYESLLGNERAGLVFTDPPYNVVIDGHVCGKGHVKHEEFVMASGEMSKEEFTNFLKTASERMIEFSEEGSIHYICMDWRHIEELQTAASLANYELKNMCVWVKDNGGMGSLYRSRHELIFVFKNGNKSHINNVQLGKHGRNRTNVWEYPGVNSFKGQMKDLALHPTVKPTNLVQDAILDCSNRGDIILDPFGGSGTTIIAAEKSERKARLIEIDPKYCDVILRRWQNLTGLDALNLNTELSFNEMENSNER